MELRPYQQEAREAVKQDWKSGIKRTLLVLPTGCGKTIVFAKIVEDCVREGRRVLILAHRAELLEQAADKLFEVYWFKVCSRKSRRKLSGELVSRCSWFCTIYAETETPSTV